MSEQVELPFSINGLPWTAEKIAEAASQIRNGGSIGFAFGIDALEHLPELDAHVFSARPDLRLSVWVAEGRPYSIDELNTLASLRNVRTLEISGVKQKSFMPLARMTMLQSLEIKAQTPLDVSFLSSLEHLQHLSLSGKFAGLDAMSDCLNLKSLYVRTTLTSYDPLARIRCLRSLILDSCTAPLDLSPLNRPSLEELYLSSIPKLDTVDALAEFSNLQRLKMRSPHMETLPDLSGMHTLHELELVAMKKWENPEVVRTLPNLVSLAIWGINKKLPAERFAFLASMPSLKRVDFRFIDDGRRRRDQIEKLFREANRFDVVVQDDVVI